MVDRGGMSDRVTGVIDPTKVTNFNRTPEELEEFLLFCIVAAGKNSYVQSKKLEDFLANWRQNGFTPFSWIRYLDSITNESISNVLRKVKMGQYQRISIAFRGVATFFKYQSKHPDYHPLREIPLQTLECIKGIGMKTSRFFVMHTRKAQNYACLDTHILKWLESKGHEVPKTTPNGVKYLELEKIFLAYANDMGMMPADLDLKIWNEAHEN